MGLGGSANVALSLQSQYFPGASTSPYGPVLTLPGTVGSYYFEPSVVSGSTNWKTYGFTVEGWINYASLANSNIYYSSAPMPNMITLEQSPADGGGLDWAVGATTTGALGFFFASTSPAAYYAITSPVNSIVTGQWTHIALQVSLTAMSLYINGVVQTLTAWNFTNTGTTTAANIPTTTPQMQRTGVGLGQYTTNQGANAAAARARIVYGSATATGNVYSMSGFTPNPNLGAVPAGATVAWQLESQYPLPTYPSFFDVPVLPDQISSYGAEPVVVGGVTSNVLGPYATLNSIRFDGTGYIDYGNAASSALTTNLWANAWTTEGWIYPTAATGNVFSRSTDLSIGLSGGTVNLYWGGSSLTGPAISLNQWTHIAATYDGTGVNVYAGGTGTSLSNRYVAIAYGSATATSSTDGINWSPSTLPSSKEWSSVTVNPRTGVFVAVAWNSTTAAYSTNGINWFSSSTLPSSSSWYAVTCNPTTGVFVAVAAGSTAYSTNGITWTAGGTISSMTWKQIAVNPNTGVFVAVANGPADFASYSTDGITWTDTYLPFFRAWNSVTCNPTTGIFVAVPGFFNNEAAYSTDGINWLDFGTLPSSSDWTSVTCNPTTGVFVAVAAFSTDAAYSTDGINWSPSTLPSSSNWFAVTVNPVTGVFVAIAYGSATAASSTNGITWTARTLSASADWYSATASYLIPGPFTPTANVQVGGPSLMSGNLADVRVSNVARYTGSSYTVPTAPFTTDSNTLLLLKSLGGQVGTTLEVQGRGLNAVSLGATQTVRAYPPAPMSSYLLDTTGNTAVTYGQGKYIASASSEYASGANNLNVAWKAFDKNLTFSSTNQWSCANGFYGSGTPATYTSSVTTLDTLGNSYSGEWLQIQNPVSVLLVTYTLIGNNNTSNNPYKFWILGSRDGANWSLVDSRTGITWASPWSHTFTVSTTQAYMFYRCIVNQIQNAGGGAGVNPVITEWTLNGTEESMCITNDSKVGIGIANPQRSLEVAGDLVVGGTISGGAGMGQFRNRIINGDMRIAQRGITSNVSPAAAGSSGSYGSVDRWFTWSRLGSKFSVQQSSVVPLGLGFSNSWLITSLSGYVPVSGDYYGIGQYIEGYNIADLNWGTSYGVPVTLSFWVRSSLVGSYSISLEGGSGFTPSYAVQYTITNSNAWQQIILTIPPPPNGYTANFLNTNGGGVRLWWDLGSFDTTYAVTTPGIWQAGDKIRVAGTTNFLGTNDATMYITGVQLEKGTVATPFEFRPFAQELALCQRYFEKSFDITTTPAANTDATNSVIINTNNTGGATYQSGFIWFKVPKRARGGTVNLYNPYIAVAVNTSLRVPASSTDVNINGTTSMINGIQVNMTQQATALSYHVHYTYACEL